MQQWTDLFLNMPLPESWMRALLFITFGLHLLFVLLMLGTALLSLVFFLRDLLRQPSPSQHWNEHVAAVTAADIRAAFQRVLQPDRMVTVIVGATP